MPAQSSCAGAEIQHVVGVANSLFVVLHNQHCVAKVAQLFERLNQAVVVALMQPDGGLVQNIKHAAESRSNLCSKTDALALAA